MHVYLLFIVGIALTRILLFFFFFFLKQYEMLNVVSYIIFILRGLVLVEAISNVF
jgi:hypothetical protein